MQIKEMIAEESGIEEIGSEMKLTDDLGFDSLDFVDLLGRLEEETGIKAPKSLRGFQTVGDLEKYFAC